MKLGKNWKKTLEEDYNFKIINNYKEFPSKKDTLFCNRCCAKKSEKEKAKPKDLYISNLNYKFYFNMENYKLNYGTLSDKYGLVLENEKIKNYELHPENLNKDKKKILGREIYKKFNSLDKKYLIFYNTSPLMSLPYLEMLVYSKLDNLFFFTNLKLIKLRFGNNLL